MHKFLAILWRCTERGTDIISRLCSYERWYGMLWMDTTPIIRRQIENLHPAIMAAWAWYLSSGDTTIMLLSSVFSPLFLVRSVYVLRRAWVQWIANLWCISIRRTKPFVYSTHMLFKPCYLTFLAKTRSQCIVAFVRTVHGRWSDS